MFCSDIYSFGITIDEVLTAKVLVPDNPNKNQEDYFKRIDLRSYRKNMGRQEVLCENLSIPGGLKEIIKKATKYEPAIRYQNMGELLMELKNFL